MHSKSFINVACWKLLKLLFPRLCTKCFFFSSLFQIHTVYNLEFCPEESVWAVQKDSKLLFSHNLPCTGNKTHKCTHRILFPQSESHECSDLTVPALNTNECVSVCVYVHACVLVRAYVSDSLSYRETALLVC